MVINPKLTYEILTNAEQYKKFNKQKQTGLLIYLFLIIIIQFIINASVVSEKCGGNVTENLGPAGLLTIFPWLFIFGTTIIVIMLFPGFKTAFADVIGYFYVSGQANIVLTDLLINKHVQQTMDSSHMSVEQKDKMEDAADAIVKICGNTSILINQIVPTNFNSYWGILLPLMKKQYQTDGPETYAVKNKLFDLVVTRDNIGEMMWYVYTGLLLTSIVQMKIATTPCYVSKATMEKNYQAYLKDEKAQEAQLATTKNTEYTVTT
jgi:hypothetical protein